MTRVRIEMMCEALRVLPQGLGIEVRLRQGDNSMLLTVPRDTVVALGASYTVSLTPHFDSKEAEPS